MQVTIIKQNEFGAETWRYQGEVVAQDANSITIEAPFNYPKEIAVHGLHLRPGDRFVETFFSDRSYNIFEIHAREDDRLKGWYCNIATPAVITIEQPGSGSGEALANPAVGDQAGQITYHDLALDLIVLPDGTQTVIDVDEFDALELTPAQRTQALEALSELQDHFRQRFKA